MHYVLSLDVGTTSLKGVLFDSTGRQAAACLQEYDLLKPGPDLVELDCEVYWDSARQVIRDVLRQSQVDPQQIGAVGITSQGETLTVLDKDGHPCDARSSGSTIDRTRRPSRLAGQFSLDEVYRITGQQEMIATWTATRILWIRKHQPEVFQKAGKYLLVEDYLIYRLTGRYATDRALNPSTLYYDLTTGQWWPEMLRFLGIASDQLPELKDSGEAAGSITAQAAEETGLSTRCVVTTAPIDQVAGAVGAGNIEPGVITETTGAALAICASVDRPTYDPQKRVGLYSHAAKGEYVLLPWTPAAGMVLRWFRDELGGGLDYAALTTEAQDISPGADGLIVLPHLCGAGCPQVDPKAKGIFWGVTLGHRRGHFVRAILEAIAVQLRGNLDLLEELGVPMREIRSLGGAARSDLWLQIKADVCRRDLLVMECKEAACLGVAMLACVGGGIYPNLAAARDRMVHVRKIVRFDPASARNLRRHLSAAPKIG